MHYVVHNSGPPVETPIAVDLAAEDEISTEQLARLQQLLEQADLGGGLGTAD